MKERPILFSAPMVRAILAGRKTQTRRILKPQPYWAPIREQWHWEGARAHASWSGDRPQAAALLGLRENCPYGAPSDRLWVRETWGLCRPGDPTDWYRDRIGRWPVHLLRASWDVEHRASWGTHEEACHWRPSIHMPRWASRLTLEVTGVRVERLHDITEEDARAEGVDETLCGLDNAKIVEAAGRTGWPVDDARSTFAALWSSINGAESCDANPWVWVVEFRRSAA